MPNDSVNHPSHYTDGKIEVIEFIEDKKLNFHRGNAVKYISRAGKKDPKKELEDLNKAKWYLEREITNFTKAMEFMQSVADKKIDDLYIKPLGEVKPDLVFSPSLELIRDALVKSPSLDVSVKVELLAAKTEKEFSSVLLNYLTYLSQNYERK
jgi:hypothetical protein